MQTNQTIVIEVEDDGRPTPKLSKRCAASIISNFRHNLEGEREYLEYHLHPTPGRAALFAKMAEADAAAEELLKEME